MLVLHFKDRTWVCRQNEWTELMQLARVGGFDLARSSDPEDTIFSNAESSRLRAALESVLDDIPNEAAYKNKAFGSRSITGNIEKLYPYPGERLTPLESLSGPRKNRVVELIRLLHAGAFQVRPLGGD